MHRDEMPFGERRLFERKQCSRMININDDQHSYPGHLRDLTVGGAFIEPQENNSPQIGKELMLTIPFGLKKDYVAVKAKIAWVKTGGIGVRFIKAETDRHHYR